MLGGLSTNDMIYDVVVRTQAEFEALIASPDWFGAHSILFVGDGGTLVFTRADGLGICVPPSVKRISATNLAIINIISFNGQSPAAFYFENLPASNDTYLEHIKLTVTGAPDAIVTGFHHCTIMRGCTCVIMSSGSSASAFNACCNIESCVAIVHGTGNLYGFFNSSRINTCTGIVDFSDSLMNYCYHGCAGIEAGDCGVGDIGFRSCSHLSNCVSNYNRIAFSFSSLIVNCIGNVRADQAIDPNGIIMGFDNCSHLSNCESTATDAEGLLSVPITAFNSCNYLTNCTGAGKGKHAGWAFYDCHYLNGCGPSVNCVSTSGVLGGANTKVDNSTLNDPSQGIT